MSMTYRALPSRPGARPIDPGERSNVGRWEDEGGALAKQSATLASRYVRYRTN